jgi:hypothetical protein
LIVFKADADSQFSRITPSVTEPLLKPVKFSATVTLMSQQRVSEALIEEA